MTSFYKEQKYNPQAFVNRRNFFANRNVSAIVLEVPNRLIGEGTVRAWATASLVGHAPEVQVSRWGLAGRYQTGTSGSRRFKRKFRQLTEKP